jgi:hypothetical protein
MRQLFGLSKVYGPLLGIVQEVYSEEVRHLTLTQFLLSQLRLLEMPQILAIYSPQVVVKVLRLLQPVLFLQEPLLM